MFEIGDEVETKPGIKTIGGWSGRGWVNEVITDPKQPDNPVIIVRRPHELGKPAQVELVIFDAKELQKPS